MGAGKRKAGWTHPNPKPEKVYEHRGIEWTTAQWANLCGVSTGAIRGWERRNTLSEMFDRALRQKGLMP